MAAASDTGTRTSPGSPTSSAIPPATCTRPSRTSAQPVHHGQQPLRPRQHRIPRQHRPGQTPPGTGHARAVLAVTRHRSPARRAQALHHHPERKALPQLIGHPPAHHAAQSLRLGQGLPQQRRLADPLLPRHQQDPAHPIRYSGHQPPTSVRSRALPAKP